MVRETDVVGRLGGEEFVLILPETRASEAMMLVERLRQHIELHDFSTGVARTRITVSFGVTASGARRNISWTTLLAEADTALYAAKRAGRNACRLHSAQPAAPGDPREPSFETA
jgi:diguanylate cyclase (GGDEF)-like protein